MIIRKFIVGSFSLLAALIIAFGCSDDGQPVEETPPPPPSVGDETPLQPSSVIGETTPPVDGEITPPAVTIVDTDKDTIPDPSDNCLLASNSDQLDSNSDGVGDLCETPTGLTDTDGDTIADDKDNCPLVSNPGQEDSNSDGVGDACSLAGGAGGTGGTGGVAGTGGAGIVAVDGSTTPPDVVDMLQKVMDSDQDTISDSIDNCVIAANTDQIDSDKNNIGDACQDLDNDSILDKNDNCPLANNTDQDIKACDFDKDGIMDEKDNCSYTANAGQEVCAGSTVGTACDGDCDGVLTDKDNCPLTANADQADKNDTLNSGHPNGVGDICEKFDIDDDNVADEVDNCVHTANADQKNNDSDESGNACDTDIDGDGYNNDVEKIAGTDEGSVNSKPSDIDNDTIADVKDNNADGDSVNVVTGDDCNDLDPNISPDKEDELDQLGVDSNCDGIDGDIVHGKGLVVATDGIDAPNCGTQVQTPCKTISYATGLIGKGGNYANVKYILLAVSGSGKEFVDNFTLPDDVDLRGGYCALEKDKYKTSLSDQSSVPDYFYRKRSIMKCMPTVKNKMWVGAPILVINGGKGVVEAIHFVYTGTADYFPAAMELKGGGPVITLNKIDSNFMGIKVSDPGEPVIEKNEYIRVKQSDATAGTYDPNTFIFTAIDINTTKSVKIMNNGEISVLGTKAVAIDWELGKKADSADAEISGNAVISAEGGYTKGISLKNLNDAVINNNTSIYVKVGKGGATSASAISLDSLDSVKAGANASVSVTGTGENLPSVNGYAFSASKVGVVEINGGNYSVSASYPTVINITAIYGYKHLSIADVNINAVGFGSAYGIEINGESPKAEIKGNTVTIFGTADNKLKNAYGLKWDEKKESDMITGRNKITNNKFNIKHAVNGTGIHANVIGKNELILQGNKILIADGDNLTGVDVKNSESKGEFYAARNAVSVGKTLNGVAMSVQGFNSAASLIDDNLLYGGWLEGVAGTETSAIGLKLSKSSPKILLNTIIGGTSNNDKPGNKPSKVYGLRSSFSKLKLLGNQFSAMSTFPVAIGPACYKYSIFVDGDYNFETSMFVDNFFHAPGTGAGKKFGGYPYDGACFTLKISKINKEEQGVGNINDMKGNSGNLHAGLGLAGGFTNFSFGAFEGIDKIPANVFKGAAGFKIPASDLRGAPRLSNGKVDIGALEFKSGETSVLLLVP